MLKLLALIPEPWGSIGLLVLAFGLYSYGDISGASRERGRCQAATIQSKLDATMADLANARAAEADATQRYQAIVDQSETNAKVIHDLQADLAKRPAAARCALSRDDARRLRNIR